MYQESIIKGDAIVPSGRHDVNDKSGHPKLNQALATAICGNDISSSCLYVAAFTIGAAGAYAPFALLIVVFTLYLFRYIYAEVGDALPLNGGAYNCLLNTTSKFKASIAACLTILSYVATAVISASVAMFYLSKVVTGLNVLHATYGILFMFAVLTIFGISESAVVALGIFVAHLVTLVALVVGGFLFSSTGFSTKTFLINWNFHTTMPLHQALFFGFAAALLGISGFESSANYIEEQADGVFVKTLRNMWVVVSVFNPLIALLALGCVEIPEIRMDQEFLLARLAQDIGGSWFKTLICIDAALVLSGAVLTSFVGVSGLMRRMTLDRCLPQYFLKQSARGTSHRIIIAFFLLCSSITLLTGADPIILGGVYTISFLGVMLLFAIGNALLKINRSRLKRAYRASWPAVLTAATMMIVGLVGNIIADPKAWRYFLLYFIPAMTIISFMFARTRILRGVLYSLDEVVKSLSERFKGPWITKVVSNVEDRIQEIESHGIVFFTKGDNIANLNLAMLYVIENETVQKLTVVHVTQNSDEIPDNLREDLKYLDRVYPQVDLDLIVVNAQFSPELVRKLSDELDIPANYMFIGAPGHAFPHNLADLGGVRLII